MATFKHLPTASLTRPGLALAKGGYRFSYDKCNRLTDAEYSETDSHEECQNYYDESIQKYDSTDYIGSLVVRNGKPDMYLLAGGYYKYQSSDNTTPSSGNSTGDLYFYNCDHLGNVREVVNEDGKLLQVNNYYPFGAPYSDNRITSMNPKLQPYKYTGKELDLVHGLNTYDYGARQYYSIVPAWDRIDPLCEKYYNVSPYAVCRNNPLISVDPNGKDSYYTQDGKYAFTNMSETDNIYIISKYEFIKSENNISYYYVYDRHRLDENKDFLSADAYSKIFTNILERYGVFDNEYNIYKDAIQVFVGKEILGKIQTYSKSERNADCNERQIQLAHTSPTTHKITANIWDNYTKTKSGTHKDNRFMYATEHNVLSALGDHEYKGHRVKGLTSELETYLFQKSIPNWILTTPDFKSYIDYLCIQQ